MSMKLSTGMRGLLTINLGLYLDFHSGPPPDPNAAPTGDLLASFAVLADYGPTYTGEQTYEQALLKLSVPVIIESSAMDFPAYRSRFKTGRIGYARFTRLGGFSSDPNFIPFIDMGCVIATVGTTPGEADVIVSSLDVTSPGIVTFVSAVFNTPES